MTEGSDLEVWDGEDRISLWGRNEGREGGR